MANLPGGKTGSILEVEFLSKLGQGAFGQVYRARDLKTGQVSGSDTQTRLSLTCLWS